MVTSPEEQEIRKWVATWAQARFGDDIKIIHELVLGDRRIDQLIVTPTDLIGVEIKGPKDRIDTDNVAQQLRQYRFFLPEVWFIVAPKWSQHAILRRHLGVNVALAKNGQINELPPTAKKSAIRDELCCSRLLELLWVAETIRIAKRMTVPCEYAPGKTLPTSRIKGALARMLTGHEIIKQVCLELRSRPLTGAGSDDPLNQGAA